MCKIFNLQKLNLKAYRHSHPQPMTPTSQETDGDLPACVWTDFHSARARLHPCVQPLPGHHVDHKKFKIQKLNLKAYRHSHPQPVHWKG